jgi:hypothetical protein
VRDDDVRSSCFAALDVLQAQHGPELPYSALAPGFAFRGGRVPFLNRAYGIYRAANVQRGPAALSISSAFAQKRYQDEGTADGVLYRYQDGPIDNHFNTWLRQAHLLDVPLVYFIGTRPNWYRPEYPAFVEADYPTERSVLISFGVMRGPVDEQEPVHIGDPIERPTSSGWSSSESTRRSSVARYFPRTSIAARSARSRRSACSTPRISSETLMSRANRW